MTVDYMKQISGMQPFNYVKILFQWRGSITKSIVTEFCCWLLLYNLISLVYRIALFGTEYGALFERYVGEIDVYLLSYGSTLNFVAAFYLAYIKMRWSYMFSQIPWPDDFCMLVSALMKRNDGVEGAKDRQIRLAICRYWNLALVLLLRDVSVLARKRFPDLDSLHPSLATDEEVRLLRQAGDILSSDFHQTCLYSLPLDWIQKIIKQAAEEGKFLRVHLVTLHEACTRTDEELSGKEIVRTRQKMYDLLAQDFICAIPISLSQIATAAPILYFALALFGKQYVMINSTEPDSFYYRTRVAIPFNTIYEFLIYMGWMKAAIAMLNPFGMDDDDFEVDYLIDRNYMYTRLLLDDLFDLVPAAGRTTTTLSLLTHESPSMAAGSGANALTTTAVVGPATASSNPVAVGSEQP